jgi:hypothetical protein
VNYYRATEKKPEHGGGWAFMQHNRRAGSAIRCQCGAGGWTDPGHATAEDAERCFYEEQLTQPLRRSKLSETLHHCSLCGAWTDQIVGAGHLIGDHTILCAECAPPEDDEKSREALRAAHPFQPGIQITASW